MITKTFNSGNLYAYINRTERARVDARAEMFDASDKYGKEIGHRVTIDREVHILATDDKGSNMVLVSEVDRWVGERFIVTSQCTRNGKDYQADRRSGGRFQYYVDAAAHAEKVLVKARKAAALKGV